MSTSTTSDAALLAEIPTRLEAAQKALKVAGSIGARTKAIASEQAWTKVQQLAARVITRGREEYRATLEEKLSYAREVDAAPESAPRFTN